VYRDSPEDSATILTADEEYWQKNKGKGNNKKDSRKKIKDGSVNALNVRDPGITALNVLIAPPSWH